MNRIIFLLITLAAMPVSAQVLVDTPRGIVAAHDGVVELFDRERRRVWSAAGLDDVTCAVANDDRVALLDAWTNRVRIVSLSDGSGETFVSRETPIAAVFVQDQLYVVERDSRTVSKIGSGETRSLPVAADPAFIRSANGLLYVYSRADGLLQEIDPRSMTIVRTKRIGAFASDLEIDGRSAYLVYPREATLLTVNLEDLSTQESSAGGTPTDIAVARRGNALTASLLAVADPGAKRVWMSEGAQSFGAAFGRGFLRGLLGLGLYRTRDAELPTGVDRVVSGEGVTGAFDVVSGTLYVVDGSKTRVIAQDVAPQAFTVSEGRIAFWRDRAVVYAD